MELKRAGQFISRTLSYEVRRTRARKGALRLSQDSKQQRLGRELVCLPPPHGWHVQAVALTFDLSGTGACLHACEQKVTATPCADAPQPLTYPIPTVQACA
jgi:hypothetical protein